ncbi:MAG: 2-hydroxychromene-2-carboxylate isomerase [Geminicoccaceae bacterium]
MPEPIDFYFDFSSPYGYLASRQIGALAGKWGRAVTWRPMMLGAAFAATGGRPLVEIPLKGDYMKVDLVRTARLAGIPFRLPSRFPLATLAAARTYYWLVETSPAKAVPFAEAAFVAYFAEDRDISDRAVVADLLNRAGIDAAAAAAAIATPEIKDRLRAATDEAVARGVFGSPFFFVDGEPFWGFDRLPQIERRLAEIAA